MTRLVTDMVHGSRIFTNCSGIVYDVAHGTHDCHGSRTWHIPSAAMQHDVPFPGFSTVVCCLALVDVPRPISCIGGSDPSRPPPLSVVVESDGTSEEHSERQDDGTCARETHPDCGGGMSQYKRRRSWSVATTARRYSQVPPVRIISCVVVNSEVSGRKTAIVVVCGVVPGNTERHWNECYRMYL
jgi:hypothetical protein